MVKADVGIGAEMSKVMALAPVPARIGKIFGAGAAAGSSTGIGFGPLFFKIGILGLYKINHYY